MLFHLILFFIFAIPTLFWVCSTIKSSLVRVDWSNKNHISLLLKSRIPRVFLIIFYVFLRQVYAAQTYLVYTPQCKLHA